MQESENFPAADAQAAAPRDADVAVEHLGDVYAKVLFGGVLDEFDALVSEVLQRYPKLEEILGSALISHEEKCDMIDRLFGSQLSPLLIRFLKVVSQHGRLDCLRVIHRRAHSLYDEMRGRVEVQLTTAAPLDDAAAKRVTENLRTLIGGEPIVRYSIDPNLIGGAVVRVGDTVYDGSIANQLQNTRQQMIDRSVHEIQSRRNRFRYSAGD